MWSKSQIFPSKHLLKIYLSNWEDGLVPQFRLNTPQTSPTIRIPRPLLTHTIDNPLKENESNLCEILKRASNYFSADFDRLRLQMMSCDKNALLSQRVMNNNAFFTLIIIYFSSGRFQLRKKVHTDQNVMNVFEYPSFRADKC